MTLLRWRLKKADQNAEETVTNEGAEESDVTNKSAKDVMNNSVGLNETAVETLTDAELDEESQDSQDDISSFCSKDLAEVQESINESINEFSSSEPPSKERKRESIVEPHDQKRSKTDDNPP